MTLDGGGSGALVVSGGVEALFEELVGEHARLREAINSAVYFKIDPAVTGVGKGDVFRDEFFGGV